MLTEELEYLGASLTLPLRGGNAAAEWVGQLEILSSQRGGTQREERAASHSQAMIWQVPTYKLTLEYDGTRYHGWQEQKNAKTVAGELRRALEEVTRERVDLGGAGRTDAGVHARAQVAHVRMKRKVPVATLLRDVNALLPSDIVLTRVEPAAESFHARHHAKSRSYVYQLSLRKTAFDKKYVWWVKQPLDLVAMQTATSLLAGRHDFSCFSAGEEDEESPIVVVNHASWQEADPLLLFRIEASHFLWRMVRRVVGTLVRVGTHEVTQREWEELLAGRCPGHLDIAAWTAPGSGLFLEEVRY